MDKSILQDSEINLAATIKPLIYEMRGVRVMLDRDLAQLYQVDVAQLNRQVKRNIERFPEDFMFTLTAEEYAALKCQNGISNTRGGDRRLPHAFTEQGLAMLSTIRVSVWEVSGALNTRLMYCDLLSD